MRGSATLGTFNLLSFNILPFQGYFVEISGRKNYFTPAEPATMSQASPK
jgi:hypothetical protein